MIDNIKKFGRSFLVAAAVAGAFLVPATPVFADDPPTSQQQQRFQINGTDSQRGPFSGQITLTQLPSGQVNVEREVTFQRDGQTLVQAGTGQQRGNEVRARLTQADDQQAAPAPAEGLSGALGSVGGAQQQGAAGTAPAPAEQDEARLQLRINAEQGTCQGQCTSDAGTSREQGQTLPVVSDQAAPTTSQASGTQRNQGASDQAPAPAGLPIEAPVVANQAPSVTSNQAPTTSPSLPSDQTSPSLPSDQTSPSLPSDQTSPSLPSNQTSPSLPSDQTSPSLPSVPANQASTLPSVPANQASTLPSVPANQASTLPAPAQAGGTQQSGQGRSQSGR